MSTDRVNRKRPSTAFSPLKAMQKTERNILNAERENIRHATDVADNLSHTAMEYTQKCMDQFTACFQTGGASACQLQGLGQCWVDCYSEAMSDYVETYSKALSCRNPHEMMDMQFGLMHRAFGRYFDFSKRLRDELFNGCERGVAALGIPA